MKLGDLSGDSCIIAKNKNLLTMNYEALMIFKENKIHAKNDRDNVFSFASDFQTYTNSTNSTN